MFILYEKYFINGYSNIYFFLYVPPNSVTCKGKLDLFMRNEPSLECSFLFQSNLSGSLTLSLRTL